MNKPVTPKLISLQTASAEYGPPYTSIRDWVIKGLLPVVRVGDTRRLWVRREDLERLIERSTERSA